MKCSHDACKKDRESKSKFCNQCIQLNTKACNYCTEEKMVEKKTDKVKETIIKCPKCKINMGKMSNGRYVIDKCPKCKGIFLDGDEIQNIKHISFFHYVRDYFRRDKHA